MSATLSIDRLVATVVVAADAGAAHDAVDRIADTAQKELARAVASTAAPLLEGAEGLCFIRRLEIDLAVDVAADGAEMARHWAGALTRELHARMTGGSDADVVWFGSRVEYVARYLAARATGSAARSWWFGAFDGLSFLPPSAAIRTALCDDSATGRAALAALSATEVRTVLACLTETDAERLLSELWSTETADPATTARVIAEWHASASALSGAAFALDLCLRAGPPRRGLAAAAKSVAAFDQVRRMLTRSDTDAFIDALVRGTDIDAFAPGALREVLRPLCGVAAEGLRPSTAVRVSDRPSRQHTPWGGVFLLLPGLARLPIDEATSEWRDPAEASAAAVVRLAVLGACFGPIDAPAVMADRLIRAVAGVAPDAAAADLAHWTRSVSAVDGSALTTAIEAVSCDDGGPLQASRSQAAEDAAYFRPTARSPFGLAVGSAAHAVIRDLTRRMPGFANASGTFVRANILGVDAVIDDESGRHLVYLSRPPLDVVLSLAGLNRMAFDLPWLDGARFELFGADTVP